MCQKLRPPEIQLGYAERDAVSLLETVLETSTAVVECESYSGVSIIAIKHHYQKQFGKERVHFSLQFFITVHHLIWPSPLYAVNTIG